MIGSEKQGDIEYDHYSPELTSIIILNDKKIKFITYTFRQQTHLK